MKTSSTIERLKENLTDRIFELNQEIIEVEKPSDEHTILMMEHSKICGILEGMDIQHTEDVEEFKKKIDDMPCLDKRHISHPCQEHPKIINADELKSSLDDRDTEEKVSHIVKEDDDEVGER